MICFSGLLSTFPSIQNFEVSVRVRISIFVLTSHDEKIFGSPFDNSIHSEFEFSILKGMTPYILDDEQNIANWTNFNFVQFIDELKIVSTGDE